MLSYPNIDPVLISLGPVKIYWYGMMYVIGISAAWLLARSRREKLGLSTQQIEDLIFYAAMGVILGGRLGYTFFYNLPAFLSDPMIIFRIWEGGMSFHGGLLGVFAALAWYGHKFDIKFIALTDFIGPLVPLGLGAGRIGNFINAELWGKVSDLPWAMIFPGAGSLPRHPSMLYEAILEGLVLFIILQIFILKPRPLGAVSGLFMLLYGSFRFIVEFVRTPDAHIGYLAYDWLTMGHVLSMPMILIGIFGLILTYRIKG